MAALDVAVDAQQETDPPWTYRAVTLHFRIECDAVTVPIMARAIRLSIVRYCSVITTIAGVAAIAATVELVGSDGTTTGRQPIELALPAAPYPPAADAPRADEDEPSST